MIRFLAAAASAAVLAGCASTPAASGPGPGAAIPAVSLVVTVTPRPGAAPHRWTLRCQPAGGTHPYRQAACHRLLTVRRPFAPVPRGTGCAMVVSGPQTATIRGSWFGRRVDASFSLRDSCETTRWHKLGIVLGPAAPVS